MAWLLLGVTGDYTASGQDRVRDHDDCLGTWAIGGRQWGPPHDEASIGAIHAAIDHGINWVDTAPFYGAGHSEEVVGRALKKLTASCRPLVFTKFGLGLNVDVPMKSASAGEVIAECEASLQRVSVDQINLYQRHWPAPQPIAETAGACAQLLAAGKIRAIGVSNFSVAQLEEWRAAGVPLHSDQPPYSILRRPRPGTSCRGARRTTSARSRTRRRCWLKRESISVGLRLSNR